jgi:hypothetical protein
VLLAATSLEARALRRELPDARVVTAGVGLSKIRSLNASTVISCGLAGGLRSDLPTGTLLLPREVRRPDGRILRCDDELVAALTRGARSLGYNPNFEPMLTSDAIVNAAQRSIWAQRGFAAVDMETGFIEAPRVAAARVVLDTPSNELSQDWQRPLFAMIKPWNWRQMIWLAREAPAAARIAARVVGQGLRT